MHRKALRLAAVLALVFPASAAAAVEIKTLSSRADLVSGGDALVEVVPGPGVPAAALRMDLNGRDVTDRFAVRPDGRLLGVVDGLADGRNTLTARVPGTTTGARLTLANHPVGGPLFAGPQIQPWTCFDGALDRQCNRPVEYALMYKSSQTGSFAAYDPASPPPDLAETTTDNGVTVPYIVRVETGTIDRDQYRIAVLFDPAKPWAPWAPQPQFNHKLVITHGASCDTAYVQAEAPDVLNDTALSRGFAVMSHALDNSGHNCNIIVQAEALAMTKEHLIEDYGELRYTIGSGCSGGALAQQAVANAYPGIYQGITPACSFPDSWSAGMLYEDYLYLRGYFENPTRWAPGVVWDETDIAAVWGHPSHANALTYNTAINPTRDPSRSCTGLAADQVYDAEANPKGVRCSLQDYMVSIFGKRRRETWTEVEKQVGGFAGKPSDNTGIEYGLNALIAGDITPAQFVDVNEKVGGRDIDYNVIEGRTVADVPALERVYRSGGVNQATHLDKVAIIDLRGPDPGAFHDVYRTYAVRARLDREHGHHDNHVSWRGPVPLMGDADFASESIVAMDEWLAAVEKDPRDIPLARKLVQDKPKTLTDRCADGVPGGGELPAEVCDTLVESYTTARIEARGPFADDTIKCETKPLRRSDHYPVRFSASEWERLQEVFPDGVCDYAKPGVDRVPTVAWLTYEDGPGGKPLGAAPRSQPLDAPAPAPATCTLRVRVRAPRGDRIASARVYVDGKRVASLRAARARRPIAVRTPRSGTVRVRVVARTRDGRRVVLSRRYRACRPR